MKRLNDYDEYGQAKPKNKPLTALGLPSAGTGYVTNEEFVKMQADLEKQLKEQTSVLEQLLEELKQLKLHIASMSGEDVEKED